MGDRGNIVVLQGRGKKKPDQVWFYAHWGGYSLPARLQKGLLDGEGRWRDDHYLARIIFCRVVRADELLEETGYGISCRICDNEHPILVCDTIKQRVYLINQEQLVDGQVPAKFEPKKAWTFKEFTCLQELPWGEREEAAA